jgi:hypothetical protein
VEAVRISGGIPIPVSGWKFLCLKGLRPGLGGKFLSCLSLAADSSQERSYGVCESGASGVGGVGGASGVSGPSGRWRSWVLEEFRIGTGHGMIVRREGLITCKTGARIFALDSGGYKVFYGLGVDRSPVSEARPGAPGGIDGEVESSGLTIPTASAVVPGSMRCNSASPKSGFVVIQRDEKRKIWSPVGRRNSAFKVYDRPQLRRLPS